MARGRPQAVLVIAPPKRERLTSYARRYTSAQALALRARIVLLCAEGATNGTSPASSAWRARLVARRMEGLLDEPRPGVPRKITDRDIVGLYLDPPDRALVLCVDGKSEIQALDRTQPLLPMRPGQVERRTHAYVQHGTRSLFAALDVATGKVIGACHRRHRPMEFQKFLQLIDERVPQGLEFHLILDGYGKHEAPSVRRWLVRHPQFHLHFTPTSASQNPTRLRPAAAAQRGVEPPTSYFSTIRVVGCPHAARSSLGLGPTAGS